MNIMYSTDENYSKICLSSIRSVLEKNKKVEELKIYIIDNNILKDTRKEIENVIKKYERKCFFIPCEEICKNVKKNNEFPISAYARLFVQDNIKENKIIYLDCDTIVKKDLTELWNIDLKDNWIAGVQDPLPEYLKKAIEMNSKERYINSGVLVINLKKWRHIDFKTKVIQYMKDHNNNVVHHDQGIINGICNGKILYLEPKFNLMPEMITMSSKQIKKLYKMKDFYTEQQLKEARTNPTIIHYICKFYNRPWFKECTHPYKDSFLKYYNGKLISKPLSIKIKLRKFVFLNFPFSVYCIIENILDFKRKKYVEKITKKNSRR